MIKVLIVDDHTMLRRGLRESLSENADIVVGGEATNAEESLERLSAEPWDVVLLDIALPGLNGLELLKQIKERWSAVKVLAFSFYPEEHYGPRMIRAGASGYLSKDSEPKDLVDAVRKVASGGHYMRTSLVETLARNQDPSSAKPPHFSLSDREFEVFCLLGMGCTVKQVAAKLSLSDKTISTYRQRILGKMQFNGNLEIIRYVLENHLAPLTSKSSKSNSPPTPVQGTD